MSTKEQNRLHILNGVLERYWSMGEATSLLEVSERQGWRLLAAYRKDGAAALVHKNRGRVPPNATGDHPTASGCTYLGEDLEAQKDMEHAIELGFDRALLESAIEEAKRNR